MKKEAEAKEVAAEATAKKAPAKKAVQADEDTEEAAVAE